jgi:ribosome maturation factor RimP
MSDDKITNILGVSQTQSMSQSESGAQLSMLHQEAWVGGCPSGVWLESWVEAAELVVNSMGYQIVDLERQGRGLLRVTLNSVAGVEQVNYDRLEVSSPGVDRILRRVRDFEENLGLEVQIKLRRALNNRKQYSGVLSRAEQSGFFSLLWSESRGQTPDHELVFTLSELESARLVPHLNFRRVSK